MFLSVRGLAAAAGIYLGASAALDQGGYASPADVFAEVRRGVSGVRESTLLATAELRKVSTEPLPP